MKVIRFTENEMETLLHVLRHFTSQQEKALRETKAAIERGDNDPFNLLQYMAERLPEDIKTYKILQEKIEERMCAR